MSQAPGAATTSTRSGPSTGRAPSCFDSLSLASRARLARRGDRGPVVARERRRGLGVRDLGRGRGGPGDGERARSSGGARRHDRAGPDDVRGARARRHPAARDLRRTPRSARTARDPGRRERTDRRAAGLAADLHQGFCDRIDCAGARGPRGPQEVPHDTAPAVPERLGTTRRPFSRPGLAKASFTRASSPASSPRPRHEVEITAHAAPIALGSVFGQPARVPSPSRHDSPTGGLPTETCEDMQAVLWAKMLYNCALNPLGALAGRRYGELTGRSDDARDPRRRRARDLPRARTQPRCPVAWPTAEAYLETFYRDLIPPTRNHESSMLQDLRARRPSEIEALSGAVERLGRRARRRHAGRLSARHPRPRRGAARFLSGPRRPLAAAFPSDAAPKRLGPRPIPGSERRFPHASCGEEPPRRDSRGDPSGPPESRTLRSRRTAVSRLSSTANSKPNSAISSKRRAGRSCSFQLGRFHLSRWWRAACGMRVTLEPASRRLTRVLAGRPVTSVTRGPSAPNRKGLDRAGASARSTRSPRRRGHAP